MIVYSLLNCCIKSLNRKACNFLVSKYFAMCKIIIV